MADVIAKLQVDAGQFDQNLKKAVEQMTKMEQEVRRTGATFAVAYKEDIEFVKSIGELGTKATTAKQQLREYTDAITSLTATYRAMTDEEKNSDTGKALAASIDQIKIKAAELKDIMSDTNREIQNLASDTSFTDGLNLMTRTLGTSMAAITAWTGDSKEMEVVIKDLAKIGTTVAAVDQLTKAFQKQNLVLLKNPYVAAAAAVVALGVAIGKLIKKSQELSAVDKALQDVQQKGRENSAQEITRIDTLNNILHDNTRSLEERKTALAEIQNLVPDYHGALTEEGNLINDNTGAIDDYIVSLQRAATAQAAFDRMVEIQKQKMEEQLKLEKAQKELESARSMQSAGVPNGAAAFGGGGGMSVNTAVAGTNNMAVKGAEGTVNKIQSKIDELDAQSKALQALIKADDISTDAGKTKTKGGGTTTAKEDVILPEGSIAELEQKIKEKREELRMAITQDSRDAISKDIAELQVQLDEMLGKVEQKPVEIPIKFTEQGINTLGSQIKGKMSGAEIGSEDYKIAAENLLDFTTFENLLKAATERGITPDTEWMASLFEDIKIGADVDDETWQAVVDHINELIEGTELPSIVLNVKTGGIEEAQKDMGKLSQNVQGAIGAFGQLGGAMQQIEDPSAKVAGIIMAAIANVAGSFAKALMGSVGPWDWIAAALSGTAVMISTIAAIKSATSGAGHYANGGIVPGNSLSGDNVPAMLNSQEIVLNTAQTGNLAGALQSNPMGNMRLSTEISGSDLRVVLNNDNRQRGGSRNVYGVH